MRDQDLLHDATASAAAPLDECWKRIGVLGDGTCERLEQYVRCLNCPVFERAAARMLDRPAQRQTGTPIAQQPVTQTNAVLSRRAGSLVFRVGAEWLALPASALRYVGESRPIHTLPHARSAAVLGVVNVRGVLTLAASLAELLHIEAAASGGSGANNAGARIATPRLLVTEWDGEMSAFPVDDVEGVAYFNANELLPAPATLAHAAGRHVRGVFAWRGRSVGVLEPDALFGALTRSLR